MSERLEKAKAFIDKDVAERTIVVFAKSWCGHCKKTKDALAAPEFENVDVAIYDLDKMEDGPAVQKALKDKTTMSTVPQIFVKGKFLGGNTDIQEAIANGTLLA